MKYDDFIKEIGSRYCSINPNQIDIDSYWQKIVKLDNPFIYDRIMKLLEFKCDVSVYNEKRNGIISRRILSQKSDNILDCLVNITSSNYDKFFFTEDELDYIKRSIPKKFDECIRNISDRWLLNYIIYYFFQDNYYNFMCNLFQMTGYLHSIKKDLIDLKHLELYNMFNNLSKLSFKEKIDFFKENYDKLNVMELFYDDMRKVKNHSYQNLVDSSLKINKENGIYNGNLSSQYGIDVYYLNGEDFYGLVRTFSGDRVSLCDNEDYIYSRLNKYGYSFSYISNHNIGTSDLEQKAVTLLYDNIDSSQIAYVHHDDAHTGRIINKLDRYISEKINEISTPKGLMYNTKSYNEIFIRPKNGEIKPKALICYDEIHDEDVLFAKKYNLAIVIINREKYKHYNRWSEDYEENTYII